MDTPLFESEIPEEEDAIMHENYEEEGMIE